MLLLQHGLQVVGDGEGRLSLALDLIHRNSVRNLDEGQSVGEVDVKDTLHAKLV